MESKDFKIYIPTRGRSEDQRTIENLPGELLKRTYLLVDHCEYDIYEDQMLPVGIERLPEGLSGIGNVRQWGVENCNCPYLFLLDDDMQFYKRIDGKINLRKSTDQDLIDLFSLLVKDLSQEYPIVGVSARQGNNHKEEDYVIATRQMNFHGVNVERFKKLGLRFDKQDVMEDFHMVLDLLLLGIPNKVYYKYAWAQKGSGEDGGCSLYRTAEVQKQNAEQLAEAFPRFVTVVKKKTKCAWKDFKERYDVRVQWKKAYQEGIENNKLCDEDEDLL